MSTMSPVKEVWYKSYRDWFTYYRNPAIQRLGLPKTKSKVDEALKDFLEMFPDAYAYSSMTSSHEVWFGIYHASRMNDLMYYQESEEASRKKACNSAARAVSDFHDSCKTQEYI